MFLYGLVGALLALAGIMVMKEVAWKHWGIFFLAMLLTASGFVTIGLVVYFLMTT